MSYLLTRKKSDCCYSRRYLIRDRVVSKIVNHFPLSFHRETDYQTVLGKRPPSIVATDLTREANKYQEAHAKASESNQALHKAMTLHVNNLRILAQPLAELMAHVPSPKNRSGGNYSLVRLEDERFL